MDQDRPPADGGDGRARAPGPAMDELGAIEAGEGQPGVGPAVFGWFADASARWWGRPLLVSVTALAAMAVLTLATIAQSPSAKSGGGAPAPAGTPAPRTAPTGPAARITPATSATPTAPATPTAAPKDATPSPAASRSARSVRDAVAGAVGGLGVNGTLSVAVTGVDGGALAAYDSDDDTSYDTASVVKVDILAALLLRDQRAGTELTSYQRDLATAMIEHSDNDAATALYDDLGGPSGLDAQNARLGLTHTTGGPGELWGLTQTTAGDQIALLRAVFGHAPPLSSGSRAYLSGLMGSVETDQRWGVSAAGSGDDGSAVKDGWLQRTATGLWDINSIGEVAYDGRRLLVSVLSSGQRSEQAGIDQVERVARAAVRAYAAAGG